MAHYVYLLASSKHGTLYIGVTNDLVRRGYEHRTKAVQGFTARYGVTKLVWFEMYDDAPTAIARERALKKWRRDWRVRLIEEQNGVGGFTARDIKLILHPSFRGTQSASPESITTMLVGIR